jgi:hypothetical protein
MRMRSPRLHLLVLMTCLAMAGCARARASVPLVMPELVPPPPPPRMIERIPDELPTIGPSPVENALAAPPAKPPARPPSKPEPPTKPDPDPDPIPVEPERPPANPPALTLKPVPGVSAQTEASIRALLETAQRSLQRVNQAALNADGQAQFLTARRFKEQAEEALKGGNFPLASKLADKAATMAAVLVR